MIQRFAKNSGYTMVELLFYIALFVVLALVVINSLGSMTASFKEIRINGELADSSAVMERITREIRQANSIGSLASTTLVLNTTDEAGTPKTVQFSLAGANVEFSENGVLTGNLNSANVAISGLNFTEITTTAGKAVKIFYSARSLRDSQNRVYDFYDTVVLRGQY